ncbi:hypothetical protein SDC9_212367 [bioreactor metagenome]|uniref:Glycosyl hydrolases family 38 C-terminal domain-containing protein n=1 Tax=bioreactor metagenome TaxID=1076179 RepID=A0A645JLV6_9ZZZZ
MNNRMDLPSFRGGFSLESRELNVSLFKFPEDGAPNTVVVRIVNYSEHTGNGQLTCPDTIVSAFETDLLEQPLRESKYRDNLLTCVLSPYEIKTYRVTLKV